MADISKEELENEIAKILENANLAKTTTKKVIAQLEKKLGVTLADKKKLIDQLVMDYVNSKESDEDDEEEEKVVKKPSKRKQDSDDDYNVDDDIEDVPLQPGKNWMTKDQYQKAKRNLAKAKEAPPPKKKGKKAPESDEEEEAPPPKKKGKKSEKGGGGGRGKGGGYTRTYKLSPALADLMGKSEMPRHEVVKGIWKIIKEKKLYDPNNKQFAICDDALYKVIGTKRFRAFGMMKYLKDHFLED